MINGVHTPSGERRPGPGWREERIQTEEEKEERDKIKEKVTRTMERCVKGTMEMNNLKRKD